MLSWKINIGKILRSCRFDNKFHPHTLLLKFFMEDFYRRQNPDVVMAGVDLFTHYLKYGWREGRQPSPYFSPTWYLARYPDIAAAKVEPLQHFVATGLYERRQPHYLIDVDYYLSGAPDVVAAGVNPYLHFIEFGDREGRSPHPLYTPVYYRANGPDIGTAPPFAHYAEFGSRQGRSPCPAFDPQHYCSHYPDEADEPMLHYLLAPANERPHVHPLIDGNYLIQTAHNAAHGMNPLVDYMQFRSHLHWADVARGMTGIPRPSRALVGWRKGRHKEIAAGRKVSVVVPCYKSNLDYLDACIASILAQTYTNWELVLVDDGSPDTTTWPALEAYQARDARVRTLKLYKNHNISAATNAAINVSDGEFLAFVDHDDVLTPDALAIMMAELTAQNADAAYSDQAFLSADNVIEEPYFKPDWSPTLFAGVMYVGHLLIVRTSVARKAGLFRSQYDGCQDYEFMLRVGECTDRIVHVPRILYHWRRSEGSVATNADAKGKIEPKQAQAVAEHFTRIGFNGIGEPDDRVPHRLRLRPRRRLHACEIDVVVQGPAGPALANTKALLDASGIQIKSREVADWSRTPAACVAAGHAPFILFLDPEIAFVDDDWFRYRIMHAERDDVAFAASHVYGSDGRVISAGLVAMPHWGLLDAYAGFAEGQDGTGGTLFCDREVAALGAACTLIARARLDRIGGLSSAFVSCDGAVRDASYRATLAGLRNVSTATRLVECDARTQGPLLHTEIDRQLFLDAHGTALTTGDRYYNPNLASDQANFLLN